MTFGTKIDNEHSVKLSWAQPEEQQPTPTGDEEGEPAQEAVVESQE